MEDRPKMANLLRDSLKAMSRSSLEIRCVTMAVPHSLFLVATAAGIVLIGMSVMSLLSAVSRLGGFSRKKEKEA